MKHLDNTQNMNVKSKKVSNIFLYLIFFCYACEGMAEQVIGSVWPSISKDLNIDISLIGTLSIIIYLSSGIASLCANKVRNKLGTNYTTVLVMSFFAISVIIYYFSKSFISVAIGMFITGLGLGINDVDADSYVIKAYDAKQDSILHSFWGLGAFIGPAILTFTMTKFSSYRIGFVIFFIIFLFVILFLLILKKRWQKQKPYLDSETVKRHSITEEEKQINTNIFEIIKIENVAFMLLCFGVVNAMSRTLSMFIATILVEQNGISEIVATSAVGLFCFAEFVGRIALGYTTEKFNLRTILIVTMLLEAGVFIVLFLEIFNGNIPIILTTVLGILDSIFIPFTFAYAKEIFKTDILSTLFGYGNVFGLVCTIIISWISAKIISSFSIRYIEVMYIVLLATLFLLLMQIKKVEK